MSDFLRNLTVVEWLGIAGFFLCCLALLFNWRQHAWAKRIFQKERQEQVSVKPRLVIGHGFRLPTMVVQVVNSGRIPIHMKQVVIRCGDEGRKVGNSYVDFALHPHGTHRNPLAVGDASEFLLSTAVPRTTLDGSLRHARRKVAVVVMSKAGEIGRVSGKEICDILKHVAEARPVRRTLSSPPESGA